MNGIQEPKWDNYDKTRNSLQSWLEVEILAVEAWLNGR